MLTCVSSRQWTPFVHSCLKSSFHAYPAFRGYISEPGTNKRLHNDFSLEITCSNQRNQLVYVHAMEEHVFLWATVPVKDGRHGAMVKWVDYSCVGRSQVRDLLTHFVSCPLPAELLAGHDPIHSPIILQEMILPRHDWHYWSWQQPNRLPRRVSASLWCDWIQWQSESCDRVVCALEIWLKKGVCGGWTLVAKWHCQYPCPQLHLPLSVIGITNRGLYWTVKYTFVLLYRYISKPSAADKNNKKKNLPSTSKATEAPLVSVLSDVDPEMSIKISPRGHRSDSQKKVPSFRCQPQPCGRTSLLTSWWSSWTFLPCTHRLQFHIY